MTTHFATFALFLAATVAVPSTPAFADTATRSPRSNIADSVAWARKELAGTSEQTQRLIREVVEGRSYAEIAERTGLNIKAVKKEFQHDVKPVLEKYRDRAFKLGLSPTEALNVLRVVVGTATGVGIARPKDNDRIEFVPVTPVRGSFKATETQFLSGAPLPIDEVF